MVIHQLELPKWIVSQVQDKYPNFSTHKAIKEYLKHCLDNTATPTATETK